MMTDCTVRIRNYHLDGYGHVNNARYLEFLEEARWHFFEQHGLLETLGGVQIVVARIDIRYRRSAVAGDVLVAAPLAGRIIPRTGSRIRCSPPGRWGWGSETYPWSPPSAPP